MPVEFLQVAGPRPPHKREDFVMVRIELADPATGEPERHIRACPKCGLEKITIISDTRGPRLYRWPEGMEFEQDYDPECRVMAITGANAA